MGRGEGCFSLSLAFCKPPLARLSTTCRHGNQLKKVLIHQREAENSGAFVCVNVSGKAKKSEILLWAFSSPWREVLAAWERA